MGSAKHDDRSNHQQYQRDQIAHLGRLEKIIEKEILPLIHNICNDLPADASCRLRPSTRNDNYFCCEAARKVRAVLKAR